MSLSSSAYIKQPVPTKYTPEEICLINGLLKAPQDGGEEFINDYYNQLPPTKLSKRGHVMRKALMEEIRSNSFNEQKTNFSNTTLHFLIANELTEDLQFLIEVVRITRKMQMQRGLQSADMTLPVNFTLKDSEKKTPLLFAIKTRNQRAALTIIEQKIKYGDDISIDEADLEGNTPLHYACALGMEEVVHALVEVGAEINKPNKYLRTPIDMTISSAQILKTILTSVAINPDRDEAADCNNITDNHGEELMPASTFKNYSLANLGAASKQPLPAFSAIKDDRDKVIQALEDGVIDIEKMSDQVNNLLDKFKEEKTFQPPVLKMQSEAGEEIKKTVLEQFERMTGRSILESCLLHRNKICQYLISKKANFSWLIRAAVASNSKEKLIYLLNQPDARRYLNEPGQPSGQTALHIAASKGYDEICKLLIDAGASLTKQDNSKNTPIMLAQSSRHHATAVFLQQKINEKLTVTEPQKDLSSAPSLTSTN